MWFPLSDGLRGRMLTLALRPPTKPEMRKIELTVRDIEPTVVSTNKKREIVCVYDYSNQL